MQELGQAEKLLEKIKEYEVWVFQSLVFYATGRVYLRENRYKYFSFFIFIKFLSEFIFVFALI